MVFNTKIKNFFFLVKSEGRGTIEYFILLIYILFNYKLGKWT